MSRTHLLERATAACLVLLLAACSGQQQRETPAPVVSRPAPGPVTTPQQTPRTDRQQTSAHRQLLERADAAVARGDYDAALALLERAQRIDPDNGEIYLQLARTHHASGQAELARATAERGLLYCDGRAQCDALRELTR